MKEDNAIEVHGLFKQYTRIGDSESASRHFWALRDVSFEVKKGDAVGIFGHNGSGKSTLLKILAGVTRPTKGTVSIRGRVASILDIGAGFHPELSGRKNIYLNSSILGFSKKETTPFEQAIIEYSGIGEFIDEPVKNYSSGMFLRLAFSIVMHLDFDVYLFDEVFSVGDASYNVKARKKFDELRKLGKTIIVVSHSASELSHQEKFFMIENGTITEQTEGQQLLSNYLEGMLSTTGVSISKHQVRLTDFSKHPISSEVSILSVFCKQDNDSEAEFRTDKPFVLELQYFKLDNENTFDVIMDVQDSMGNTILITAPFIAGDFDLNKVAGKYKVSCTIPAMLLNSQVYQVSFRFYRNLGNTFTQKEGLEKADVDSLTKEGLVGIVYSLNHVLAIKPTLKMPNIKFDPSVIFNTQVTMLPAFNWTVEFTPSVQ